MEFARKQLEKYGWTDGKGLGKKEDGISEPLKPKLKRSITGVGYDPAKDFTEHWWSELYNKAASNVQVEDDKGKTKKIKRKDDNFEITNNTFILKNKNKSKNSNSDEEYKDFFVRTEVFENDGAKIVRVQESESSDESDYAMQMTDEQLFAACDGRTAHKGARHGLRALGKLARIEQQEQLLLQESRFNGYSHAKKIKNKTIDDQIVEDTILNSDQEINTPKLKKKKKKRCTSLNADSGGNTNLQESESVASEENNVDKKTKKRKKDKFVVDSINLSNGEQVLKHDEDNHINIESDLNHKIKAKKKKKDKSNNFDIEDKEYNVLLEENSKSDEKIKNKKKRKSNSDMPDEVTIELNEIDKISKKAKTKSKSST